MSEKATPKPATAAKKPAPATPKKRARGAGITAAEAKAGADQQQLLGRVFKEAIKSGKYTLGAKEVIAEMKSSKVVIAASTLSQAVGEGLSQEAQKTKVPVVRVDRTSAQLGHMLGKPFRVSAIALRVVPENDLRQLLEAKQQ